MQQVVIIVPSVISRQWKNGMWRLLGGDLCVSLRCLQQCVVRFMCVFCNYRHSDCGFLGSILWRYDNECITSHTTTDSSRSQCAGIDVLTMDNKIICMHKTRCTKLKWDICIIACRLHRGTCVRWFFGYAIYATAMMWLWILRSIIELTLLLEEIEKLILY